MRLTRPPGHDALTGLAVCAFTITALWFGRQIFVPIVLAVLLSFVLAPAVLRLRAWNVSRGLSVFLVAAVAFGFIFGLSTILARQVSDLASQFPRYQTTILQKADALRAAATPSGVIGRASSLLRSLGESGRPAPRAAPPTDGSPPPPEPVPVEVHQPSPGPLDMLRSVAATVLEPLATTGIVAIFTVFILIQREDLRDRMIRLLSGGDLHRTTLALDDAAVRLSRFFLVQTMLNASFGVIVGIGLWLIGVPSPLLWGLLAAILRFVPYIGALVSALGPVALAAAVDPGWSMVIMTIALFLILEPLTGQVIEPLLYGHSTGISPIAVVVAATFWTWLWGPIGLLLSTPLTVCLVVLGQHVEALNFLNIILSDLPALTPQESFYQRVLAGDPSEVAEQAQENLKNQSLISFYDEIAVPALRLAQTDLRRGLLDSDQQQALRNTLFEVIDDLDDVPFPSNTSAPTSQTPILCLAARTTLDEAAAAMLAQILRKSGIPATAAAADALAPGRSPQGSAPNIETICLSSLDAEISTAQLRYAVRRLRRRCEGVKIIACFWLPQDTQTSVTALARDAGADFQAASLAGALDTCLHALSRGTSPATQQAVA